MTPQPRIADYALLLALAAIWGGSFVLIKLAIDTVPPVTMTAARILIGAVIFLAIVAATGRRLPADRKVWGWAMLAGLFGLALPFSLISWGEEHIDSGLAAILMAGMPLMTLVLARFAANETLTTAKLIGVGFGIVGLAILVGPQKLAGLGGDAVRQLAVVLASLCYAVNAIVQKRISDEDPYVVSALIMVGGAVLIVPVSLVVEHPWTLSPSGPAWFALLMLGIFPTGVASLITLALLRRQGAGFFAQINFLVPLTGLMWGVAILSERPPPSALLALAVIFAGIAISRGTFKLPRLASTETTR